MNLQYISRKNTKSLKTQLLFKIILWATVMKREQCSGCDVLDVQFKREKKITSLHSYLKRSIPETLFGTLANLLQSVQKHFSVRTLIIRNQSKNYIKQNSWLVSKRSTFLKKCLFPNRHYPISSQCVSHGQTRQNIMYI